VLDFAGDRPRQCSPQDATYGATRESKVTPTMLRAGSVPGKPSRRNEKRLANDDLD
jgi:hypothetical protein